MQNSVPGLDKLPAVVPAVEGTSTSRERKAWHDQSRKLSYRPTQVPLNLNKYMKISLPCLSLERLLCHLSISFNFQWKDWNFRLVFNSFKLSTISQTWSYTLYTSNNKKLIICHKKYAIHYFGRIYLGIAELCLFQMALVDSVVYSAHDYRLHEEIQIWIQKEPSKRKYKLNNRCSDLNSILKTNF